MTNEPSPTGRQIIIERLVQAREERGYKRGDLARLVGCPTQTIEKLETGKNKSTSYLLLIARALDVHEEWLVGLRDDPTPARTSHPLRQSLNDLLGQVADDDLPQVHALLQSIVDLAAKRKP